MTTVDTAVLGSRDTAMVSALLRGGSYSEVAVAARCSRSTVVRRMRDPEFRARINDLRAEMLARVTDVLAAETLGSVVTLASVRDDPTVAPTVRVRAASALLAAAVRFQAVDLQERSAKNDAGAESLDMSEAERRLAENLQRRLPAIRARLAHAQTDDDAEIAGPSTRSKAGLVPVERDDDGYEPWEPWMRGVLRPVVDDEAMCFA